jgi:hypothetical protein
VQCLEVIETLGMSFAEGEAFKAIWRSCAARTLGKLKADNDAKYNAEKVVFYGGRMLKSADSPNSAIPSESEATHRDGVGNKFKQQKTTGRWEHWKNGEWVFPSEDPQWVPDGLRTETWPGKQDWIIHVGRVAPWPEQHYQNIELEINNGPTSRYSFGTVQTLKSWESDRESPHRITRYRWIE